MSIGVNKFSAGITAEPFMFKEFRFLVSYLKDNEMGTKKEIYSKVVEDNIFQYKSPKSSLRRLNPLYKRYSFLNDDLRDIILTGSFQDATVVALFAIYKTNDLFAEFFNTVIAEKFESRDYLFSDKDIYSFFIKLELSHSEVTKWKDYTKKKIVQVITKILKDSFLLNSSKSLQKCSVTSNVKQLIIGEGGKRFIDIIELK